MEVTSNINQIELSITLDSDITPYVIDGNNKYPRNEYVTFTPNVIKSGATFTDFILLYTITDSYGAEVIPDTSGNNVSFRLETLGSYIVILNLTDNVDGLIYNIIYEIECCDFITISQTACPTFTINNNSITTDVVVTALDLFSEDGESQTPELDGVTIGFGESLTFSPASVSLYILTFTYTIEGVDKVENYILNNYCILEECIAKYIQDILCKDTRACAECPETIELNRMLALNYAYFLNANAEYGLNNFYSGLDYTETALKFADMKSIMDKLLVYCQRRGCAGTSTFIASSNNTSTTNDCGCNG